MIPCPVLKLLSLGTRAADFTQKEDVLGEPSSCNFGVLPETVPELGGRTERSTLNMHASFIRPVRLQRFSLGFYSSSIPGA